MNTAWTWILCLFAGAQVVLGVGVSVLARRVRPAQVLSSLVRENMAERKPFLLRMDPAVLESLQRWADEELRSLNGQIEFLLRRALEDRKKMKTRDVVERQGEG